MDVDGSPLFEGSLRDSAQAPKKKKKPRQMEGSEIRDQANLTLASVRKDLEMNHVSAAVDARERIKIEFYKTYDVMTGIRIAATLGGFFSMMILLVLYKNYCKPSKTLSEEQLNAAVTAAVEEEDRALKAALEATSFYTSLSKQRQSVTHDQPVLMSPRFSSVGGGFSHLAPPIRFSYLQQRGKSLPEETFDYGRVDLDRNSLFSEGNGREKKPFARYYPDDKLGVSLKNCSALHFCSDESRTKNSNDPDYLVGDEEEEEEDEDFPGECQLPDYFASSHYLSVPPDRRLSSITCSSADTSYLERRGSAFEMGRPAPPCFPRNDLDKQKLAEEGPWDFYYPIDIQVIQPTPEISPTASAETLCEKPATTCGLQVPGFRDRIHTLSMDNSEIGLAPLASISSLASLSSPSVTVQESGQENEGNQGNTVNSNDDSVGSDSVFMDEEVDTEDEVEEFSTDSEFDYGGFDDDYSFCESNKRPGSRCHKRGLQFASFDSYDASIGQDTLSEDKENGKKGEEKQVLCKQLSTDSRKQTGTPEGIRVKRKLCKTHSEPRNQKVLKQLPPWIDKGRSGYVPKRQLSVPASRRKVLYKENTKGKVEMKSKAEESECVQTGAAQGNLTPPSSCSDSNKTPTPVSTLASTLPQGHHKEMPSSKSLQGHEEKRKRFQKQKTVHEEWSPGVEDETDECGVTPESPRDKVNYTGNCNLLRLPQLNPEKDSCERLNILGNEEMVSDEGKDLFISEATKSEIC